MTNSVTFEIKARQLKALTITAAKQDVRYYLNGVAFDFTGSYPVAVSMDGHRALVIKLDIPAEHLPVKAMKELAYIVPLEAITALRTKKHDVITVTITDDGTFILMNGTETRGKLIDGKFPDWRRAVPDKITNEPAQYRANYVGDFGRIAVLLDQTYPTIAYNGESPGLFDLGESAFGVLMPFRGDPVNSRPNWV